MIQKFSHQARCEHRSNCVAQRDLLTQDLYCSPPMNLRTTEEENTHYMERFLCKQASSYGYFSLPGPEGIDLESHSEKFEFTSLFI